MKKLLCILFEIFNIKLKIIIIKNKIYYNLFN